MSRCVQSPPIWCCRPPRKDRPRSPAASPRRALQTERFKAHGVRTNTEADGELPDRVARPDESGGALLAQADAAMRLSARGYHRVLRVVRTVADLAGSAGVGRVHIAEALSYWRRVPVN